MNNYKKKFRKDKNLLSKENKCSKINVKDPEKTTKNKFKILGFNMKKDPKPRPKLLMTSKGL